MRLFIDGSPCFHLMLLGGLFKEYEAKVGQQTA